MMTLNTMWTFDTRLLCYRLPFVATILGHMERGQHPNHTDDRSDGSPFSQLQGVVGATPRWDRRSWKLHVLFNILTTSDIPPEI